MFPLGDNLAHGWQLRATITHEGLIFGILVIYAEHRSAAAGGDLEEVNICTGEHLYR